MGIPGKGGGSETVTTQLDPQTQKFVDEMRRRALQGAGEIGGGGPFFLGANAGQRSALQGIGGIQPGAGFGQFMDINSMLAGRLGQDFDPSSIGQFRDPNLENRISGAQGFFQNQRQQADLQAKQVATQGGAFGGARSALLRGSAVGDINRTEAQVLPQFLSQDFQSARGAALNQFNQGQGRGIQGLQNLLSGTQFSTGLDFQRNNALFSGNELFRQLDERRAQEPIFRNQQIMNLLNSGIGPFGQTQTATQSGGNPISGAIGGAFTGFGASGGNPIGGLIGGGLGLLGGLFG